jgi:hypothetical protein
MAASRGDRRPCSEPQCAGTMQFGRSSENSTGRDAGPEGVVRIATTAECPDPMGWICNSNAEHFRTSDSRLLRLVPRVA